MAVEMILRARQNATPSQNNYIIITRAQSRAHVAHRASGVLCCARALSTVTARGLADAESVPSATARVIPLLLGIIFFAADSRGQVRRGERDAANDVPGHRAARAPATHARSAEQKQWPRPETDEEATREEAP